MSVSRLDDPDWCPMVAEGVETHAAEDGYVLYHPGLDRVHHLNATAAVVLALCTGRNRIAEMPELLRLAFNLDAPPVDETRLCLEQLAAEDLIA